MPFGPVRKPVQDLPQGSELVSSPFPLPHDDFEYQDQRFQAYYYAPNGTRTIICVNWNTRQHRAIFVDGDQQSFTVDVRREFQITLAEVLELHGIIIHQIEVQDISGQNIPYTEAMLDQSVEDMDLLGATIWSQPAAAEPIEPFYQPELYAAG